MNDEEIAEYEMQKTPISFPRLVSEADLIGFIRKILIETAGLGRIEAEKKMEKNYLKLDEKMVQDVRDIRLCPDEPDTVTISRLLELHRLNLIAKAEMFRKR